MLAISWVRPTLDGLSGFRGMADLVLMLTARLLHLVLASFFVFVGLREVAMSRCKNKFLLVLTPHL
jgi:hypothetical protein